MGFGTLFIGYALSLNFITKQGIFWCLSSLIMFLGLQKLSAYNRHFKNALYIDLLMVAASLPFAVLEILSLLHFNVNTAISVFVLIHPIVMAVFTWVLLLGVEEISRETQLPDQRGRAIIQRKLSLIFYVPLIIMNVFPTLLPKDSVAAAKTVLVLTIVTVCIGIVYIALNLRLLYSCYMWITLPDGEDEK
ncbi:MAG: hypothetical protein IKA74_03455 [Clostridia bacterium]|nr:hypothetical protein [Clostridia bacterium]